MLAVPPITKLPLNDASPPTISFPLLDEPVKILTLPELVEPVPILIDELTSLLPVPILILL